MAEEISQRTAARLVRTIGKDLYRYTGTPADGTEKPPSQPSGGIFLTGVELDDHTAVEVRPVLRIGLFGKVGMDGMAVVGTEQQAAGQGLTLRLRAHAQDFGRPGKYVGKETAQSPLPGTAAHLFIVEEAVDLTKTGEGEAVRSPSRVAYAQPRSSMRGA